MKRKWMFFVLVAGIAAQLGVVAWPTLIRGLTLGLGRPVLFETGGNHLSDMTKGRRAVHLKEIRGSLSLNQPSGIPYLHPVYQTFSTNEQGVAQFDGFQATRPSSSCLYISGVMGWQHAEQVKVGIKTNHHGTAPYVRTYVSDEMKPTGKHIVSFNDLLFDSNFQAKGLPPESEADEYKTHLSTQAVIRLWRGYAVVEDVLFDGKPSREYIREAVRLRREAERAEQK